MPRTSRTNRRKRGVRKTMRPRVKEMKGFIRDVNRYLGEKAAADSVKKQEAMIRDLQKKHYGFAPENRDLARNIRLGLRRKTLRRRNQRGGMAPIPEAQASMKQDGLQGGLTQTPTEFQAQASGGRPEVGQVQANSPHEIPPSSRNQQTEVLAGYQQVV